MITIAYITNRSEPLYDWFSESLAIQHAQMPDVKLQVLIVDYHAKENSSVLSSETLCVDIVKPLPSFCQGEHKLTSEDYFSAVISRNTAIAYAKYPYLVFCDDLSVLTPNWLHAVEEASRHGYVVQGTYEKRKKMVVEKGVLISSEPYDAGKDTRTQYLLGREKIKGYPEWCYGCSLGLPLQLALKVNGYDEICSMTGYEDCQFGFRLAKEDGVKFVFDSRMKTIESDEHHFLEGNYFRRIDPETTREEYLNVLLKFGIPSSMYGSLSRYDSSHAQLDIVRQSGQSRSHLTNYNLYEIRNKVQSGQTITKEEMVFPKEFWFDGIDLTEK